MKLTPMPVTGALLIEPTRHQDERGYFCELLRDEWLQEAGIDTGFVQTNLSRSSKGVLRGLHYQFIQPQAKLVCVTRGSALDVAVDLRPASTTFGHHLAVELSEDNRRLLYLPAGLAHGFLARSTITDLLYQCSTRWHPESDRGLAWDDPALNIDWGIDSPLLSQRDRTAPRLAEVPATELPAPASACME